MTKRNTLYYKTTTMKPANIWLFTAIFCFGISVTLSSCSTVAEELLVPLVEYDVNKSVNNAKPGSTVSTKQQVREREKLVKEGKCPTCRGVGKTPDGRYACIACNGTGKYQQKNESDE